MPRSETERRLPLSLLFGGEALVASLLMLALAALSFHLAGRPGVADDIRSGRSSGALVDNPRYPQMLP